MVVALTDEGAVVLVEEFRPAVDAAVVCLPAGSSATRGPRTARARRGGSSSEETGYEARDARASRPRPGSAGMSSEIVNFYLAPGVRPAGRRGNARGGRSASTSCPLAALDRVGARARRGGRC